MSGEERGRTGLRREDEKWLTSAQQVSLAHTASTSASAAATSAIAHLLQDAPLLTGTEATRALLAENPLPLTRYSRLQPSSRSMEDAAALDGLEEKGGMALAVAVSLRRVQTAKGARAGNTAAVNDGDEDVDVFVREQVGEGVGGRVFEQEGVS